MVKQLLNTEQLQTGNILPVTFEGKTFELVSKEEIHDNPEDYYCISIDNEDKLFLITEDHIPTHNSLVFQLPSLIKEGMALVVSPLLALMNDQVIAANKKGIRACTINSLLTKKQKAEVLEGIKQGYYDICYVAPESLISVTMLDFLKQYGNISFISIDESHCHPPETLVATDKGQIRLDKIEDYLQDSIKALSYNIETKKYEYKEILRVYKNKNKEKLVKLSVKNGTKGFKHFISTESHEYHTKSGEYKQAKDLKNKSLLTSFGEKFNTSYVDWVSPLKVETVYREVVGSTKINNNYPYLYDLEVADNNNYVIFSTDGQIPALVHNCTSQYGHDFRPDYQKVGGVLRAEFPGIPIIALTATADKVTKEDIIKTLKFDKENTGFEFKTYTQDLDRPNIHYHVYERIGNGYKQLLNILSDVPKTEKVIIYCSTKNGCDEISRFLNTQGFKSRPYYSTVKKKDKEKFTQEFSEGKVQIMCCTSSFGLGVDEVVSTVIVMALPTTLEDLVQYFGRAGRDGRKVHSYLLFDSKKDSNFQKWLISQSVVNPARKKVVNEKIDHVTTFVKSNTCYRKQVLEYFGQEYSKENCGTCSNCIKKITL